MNINEGKQYQTKGGLRWQAYSFYAGGDFPIHGAFQMPNGRWEVGQWSKEGRCRTGSEWDLMPVPEKFVRERWVNLFDKYETIHGCKWDADNYMRGCADTRIACVCVKLEGTAGDGLEE